MSYNKPKWINIIGYTELMIHLPFYIGACFSSNRRNINIASDFWHVSI